jgi:GMP synthase (glutamine-hydrolysing)
MKIGILIAGHILDEMQKDFGDYSRLYPALLRDQGFEFDAWYVVDGEFPDTPDDADGWLVSGSRHGAYEEHDWIPPLEEFIRACIGARRPIVGICFGHQIMAQALGGKVEPFAGGWSAGRTHYDFSGVELALNAWHRDQVTELPPGARVLASSPRCAHAALLYGDRGLSIQPHPEFSADFIARLAELTPPLTMGQADKDAVLKANSGDLSNQTVAEMIADFFRQDRST